MSAAAHNQASRPLKFFFVDASATFPFMAFLLHPRAWTLAVLAAVAVVLTLLARHGYPPSAILRGLRHLAASNPRHVRSPYRQRDRRF